jgi:pyruvate dehydrogenase E1 component alpha subunit
VKQAADIAKKDYLPSLLEIRTYRYRGHSMSDPIHGHYRTKEEVEEQKRSDPITLFGSILQEEGLADEAYFESTDKRVKKIVEECVTFADNSPEPPLEELWKDVYLP